MANIGPGAGAQTWIRIARVMNAPTARPLLRPARENGAGEPETSHLAKSLTVRGDLDCDGEVRIDGHVLGQICADRLVLGATGYLEGDVIARDVRIEGRFTGRVFALNVTLDSAAEVSGRIFHNTLTVAKGARVDARMPWRPPSYFETLEHFPEVRQ